MRMYFPLIASLILVASAPAASEQVAASPREEEKFEVLIVGGGLQGQADDRLSFWTVSVGSSVRWVAERHTDETSSCGKIVAGQCKLTEKLSEDRITEEGCPALRQVVASLTRVRASERGSAHRFAPHTPLVTLVTYRGPKEFMETERLAEFEGPLVNWWLSAEETLKPCLHAVTRVVS